MQVLVITLLLLTGAASSEALHALSPRSQSAAVGVGLTAPVKGGECEHAYQLCMKNPRQKDKSVCESTWHQCVSKKCSEPEGGLQCKKDLDCELSCTEAATTMGGFDRPSPCCKGGPKHNNQCRKKVDESCVVKPTGSSATTDFYDDSKGLAGDWVSRTLPLGDGSIDWNMPTGYNLIDTRHAIFDENGWVKSYGPPPQEPTYNLPVIEQYRPGSAYNQFFAEPEDELIPDPLKSGELIRREDLATLGMYTELQRRLFPADKKINSDVPSSDHGSAYNNGYEDYGPESTFQEPHQTQSVKPPSVQAGTAFYWTLNFLKSLSPCSFFGLSWNCSY